MAPLSLLLVGLLFTVLTRTQHRSKQLIAQTQLHAVATVVLDAIEKDVRRSTVSGLMWRNAEAPETRTILSIHRTETIDANGLLSYEPRLRVYVCDTRLGTLVRRTWDPPPAVLNLGLESNRLEACRPDDADLDPLANEVCPNEQRIAKGVTLLTISTNAPEGQVGSEITLTLGLEDKAVTKSTRDTDIEKREEKRVIYLQDG